MKVNKLMNGYDGASDVKALLHYLGSCSTYNFFLYKARGQQKKLLRPLNKHWIYVLLLIDVTICFITSITFSNWK